MWFDGPKKFPYWCDDKQFLRKMNNKAKEAWLSFVAVTKKFLNNKKADNYEVLPFWKLECNMSAKVLFLNSHLDQFPENLGAVRMLECFEQWVLPLGPEANGWDKTMMADYWCSIKGDCPEQLHKHKSYKRKFLPE